MAAASALMHEKSRLARGGLVFRFPTNRAGYGVTVKFCAVKANPPGVLMPIGAVLAPLGMVAVTCVSEFTVKVAWLFTR